MCQTLVVVVVVLCKQEEEEEEFFFRREKHQKTSSLRRRMPCKCIVLTGATRIYFLYWGVMVFGRWTDKKMYEREPLRVDEFFFL